MKALRIGILAAFLITCAPAHAEKVRVVDGDTLEINGVIYRLFGIDAPEAGQKCASMDGKTWPCGKEAIAALEVSAFGDKLNCDNRGLDDYGRTLGVCKANNLDINALLVREGHAWAFRKYSLAYTAEEDAARKEEIGIWQAQTLPAWEYRANRWAVGMQVSPNGCPIKGNISGNGHIYHAPWSPWYDRTNVDPKKGERWFCNENEAIAAGWRAPYWGR